jgi:hypothetical protein
MYILSESNTALYTAIETLSSLYCCVLNSHTIQVRSILSPLDHIVHSAEIVDITIRTPKSPYCCVPKPTVSTGIDVSIDETILSHGESAVHYSVMSGTTGFTTTGLMSD